MRPNERRIMKALREKGPLSISQLSDETFIKRQHLYNYIRRLMRGHYILDTKEPILNDKGEETGRYLVVYHAKHYN